MPLFEDRSASFIVRVWCESGGELPGVVRAWRGSIELVPTGEKAFFKELDTVIAFMKPHLVALGIDEPSRFWERVDDLTDTSAHAHSPTVDYRATATAPLASARKTPRRGH
jgi:hypothetical protein